MYLYTQRKQFFFLHCSDTVVCIPVGNVKNNNTHLKIFSQKNKDTIVMTITFDHLWMQEKIHNKLISSPGPTYRSVLAEISKLISNHFARVSVAVLNHLRSMGEKGKPWVFWKPHSSCFVIRRTGQGKPNMSLHVCNCWLMTVILCMVSHLKRYWDQR